MTITRRTLIEGATVGVVTGTVSSTAWSSLTNSSDATSSDSASSALLARYNKIFASTVEEDVACWYFGTMFLQLPGRPDVPVLQAETIMVYRPVISRDRHRIRWMEIGYFRDPVTGLPARQWLNPLTGKAVQTPGVFRDGPGQYTLTESDDRLHVTLEQTGATVESVTLDFAVEADRIVLQQTERKLRGLPENGKTPKPQKATTVLTLWADRSVVDDPASTNVAASGSYSFEMQGLPAWTGLGDHPGTTIVRGIMRKTKPNEAINRSAWDLLQQSYPDFFSSGRVSPHWE